MKWKNPFKDTKLNQEEIDNLKSSVIPKPIEFMVKNHPTQKILVPDASLVNATENI